MRACNGGKVKKLAKKCKKRCKKYDFFEKPLDIEFAWCTVRP
jgi:hypothetical protein